MSVLAELLQTKLFTDLLNTVESLNKKVSSLLGDPLDIMIHYHKDKYGEDLLPLEKHGNFYDLRAAVDIDLEEGKHTYIPLGFSLYLPDGYYAEVLPRSSTFKNFGFVLANSMGIIDSTYRGMKDEWFLSVIPFKTAHISKNDRIGQFTIVKELPFELKEADWEAEIRGGNGSSGIK